MPMRKFALVRDAIVARGLAGRASSSRTPATDEDLLRVHTPEYVRRDRDRRAARARRVAEVPWSAALADAVRWTNGGCIAALRRRARRRRRRRPRERLPPRPRRPRRGLLHVQRARRRARARARRRSGSARALVVDLDLHYGNGTASLLATPPVSCYDAVDLRQLVQGQPGVTATSTASAPPTRRTAGRSPSPNGSERRGATSRSLDERLGPAIERAQPDVILYQAGADPYREDPYSPLDVGLDDLARARSRASSTAAKRAGIPDRLGARGRLHEGRLEGRRRPREHVARRARRVPRRRLRSSPPERLGSSAGLNSGRRRPLSPPARFSSNRWA